MKRFGSRMARGVVGLVVGGLLQACGGDGSEPQRPDTAEDVWQDDGHDAEPDAEPDAGPDAAPEPPDCAGAWGALQWGGALDDEVRGLAVDHAGRVLVAGYRGGRVGVANDGPVGDATGFVRWVSVDGEVAEVTLQTPATDIVEAVTQAPDGTVWFAGRTRGALAGAAPQGSFDLVLGRARPGDPMQAWPFGTARPEVPRRVVFDPLGRVVVAGFDEVYIPTNFVEAWENPWVAAFTPPDPDGPPVQVYRTLLDSPQSDFGNGLAVTADGSAWLAGTNTAGPSAGGFLAQLDGDGVVVREHTVARSPFDHLAAVAVAADGDLLVAGTTAGRLGEAQHGGQDAFVARLDPETLAPRWVRQVGGPESDWVTDLAVGPAGEVVVVAETLGVAVPGATLRGPSDVFAFAVDADGAVLWAGQWGSDGLDQPTAVAWDACGVVVGGATTGSLVPGQASGGRRDAFVLRVGPDVAR